MTEEREFGMEAFWGRCWLGDVLAFTFITARVGPITYVR
jgi:hypothetical protein